MHGGGGARILVQTAAGGEKTGGKMRGWRGGVYILLSHRKTGDIPLSRTKLRALIPPRTSWHLNQDARPRFHLRILVTAGTHYGPATAR